MREEFVEPMPAIQTKATLVLGGSRVSCFIVDVSMDEFRVAVPGTERYEGDPRLTLVTRDSVFPVRLILQEAHAGGYSYRLQRIRDVDRADERTDRPGRSRFRATYCCATGLIAVVVTSFCLMPTTDEKYPLLSLRGLRKEAFGWWSPSVQENEQVPPGISCDASLVVDNTTKEGTIDPIRRETTNELQTVSVSMITPASLSTSMPALLPVDESSHDKAGPGRNSQSGESRKSTQKKPATLGALLEEGLVGRLQSATPALVPWLFGKSPSESFGLLRMSDAAWFDLQQFESGMRGLPNDASAEAIASLKKTLQLASNPKYAKPVRGLSGVFVIASDDANIFFRTKNGAIELVRVLPIDTNGTE